MDWNKDLEVGVILCILLSAFIYVLAKDYYEASKNKEDEDDQEIS